MNESNTNTPHNYAAVADPVADDFRTSVFVVSLLINLAVFVSWLAVAVA